MFTGNLKNPGKKNCGMRNKKTNSSAQVKAKTQIDLENLLSSFINKQQQFICYCKANGEIKFVNQAFQHEIAPDHKSLIGKMIEKILDQDNYSQLNTYLNSVLGGQRVKYTNKYISRSGNTQIAEFQLIPEISGDNQVAGYWIIVTDRENVATIGQSSLQAGLFSPTQLDEYCVTDQLALEKSESKLRALFSAMHDVILVFDRDGRCIEIAPSNPELLYRSGDEALGKTLHEIFTREQADYFMAFIQKCIDNQSVESIEYQLEIGSVNHWFSATLSPIDKNKVLLVARDISKIKQTELSLKSNEEKYRFIFENSPQPMWIYDTETLAFLEVNHAAEAHYGYSKDEFLKMTLRDIRPPEDIPLLLENVKNTFDPLNNAGHWRHRKKNGEIIQVEIISHWVQYHGKPGRHVLIHDVT